MNASQYSTQYLQLMKIIAREILFISKSLPNETTDKK